MENYNEYRQEKENFKTTLIVEDISFTRGDELILNKINFHTSFEDHIALVGPNGVGKSTLMEIIVGEEKPDEGNITIPKNIKTVYVPQSIEKQRNIEKEQSVLEYFLNARDLVPTVKRLQEIETVLSNTKKDIPSLIKEYGALQEIFEKANGYTIESEIEKILSGLDLNSHCTLHTKIKTLSGGEKTKLLLAQALFSNSELLILDEPTNHLDKSSINWLINFLNSKKGTIILTSHNQKFLHNFANKTMELDHNGRSIKIYPGNYQQYLELKTKNEERETRARKKTENEINKLKNFHQKNQAGRHSKQAKSRLKKANKLSSSLEGKTKKQKALKTFFDVEKLGNQQVFLLENLEKRWEEKVLDYSKINLTIQRGEKIAVLGEPGAGKTTFLKILAGKIKPEKGICKKGANLKIGYYSQEFENLNLQNTVLEELKDISPTTSEKELRTFLGAFLFSKESVHKKAEVLSFGEKSRLVLAKIALEDNNVLILDEPSNHLDSKSKEVLSNSLASFPGTLIIVSHDEDFLADIGINKEILLPEGDTRLR